MVQKNKTLIFSGFALVLFLILLFSCTTKNNEIYSENLIVNPGFEESTQGMAEGWVSGIPDQTGKSHIGINREHAHSGNQSMEIGRIWTEARGLKGFKTKDQIKVDPNKKYILSFWYRTENIIEYPLPLSARFLVNRSYYESLQYEKSLSRQSEWTQIFWLLDTLPDDAISTDIVFDVGFQTQGSVFIDDVSFSIASIKDIEHFNSWRRIPDPETVGDASATDFKGTGFFRVEKDNKRWWLVGPEGQATWAIATMGEIPSTGNNGNADLAEWFEREYNSNRMDYARMQYELLESWGFNSFAGWTVGEFAEITREKFENGQNYMPQYRVLNFSIMGTDKDYYAKDNKGNEKGVHDHSFPDPFNPEWRKDARQRAEERIKEYRGDPWFVGWFMDNEVDYKSLYKYVWGDYSSREFIRYLENKYEDIQELNRSWTSKFGTYDYSSFSDILNNKPEPAEWSDPLYEDFTAFERIMIKEYVDYTYHMVKELDPDHLLISNRLNLGPMESLYRTIDLWSIYDVICVNIYPENLFIGFSKGELEIIDWIHEETGRPIIIGEWSVPALNTGLYDFGKDPFDRPLDWSWPNVVKDQSVRAEAYEVCMKQLTSKPHMIGAAWFKVFDVDSPTRRSNRGLINMKHQPYEKVIRVVSETNREIKEKMNLAY